jgi:hypothetical protein
LFCPSGFLDGSWWHRTYWVYGRSFAGGHGGYYQAGKFAPAGRILVFDDQSVYGFGRKPQYYRWTTPLEHQLFATDKQPPELPESFRNARRGTSSMIQFEKTPAMNPAGKAVTVEAWVKADRPDGAIVARGGPAQGYALLLRGGRPRFAIRTNDQLFTVSGQRRVVGQWVHLAGVLTADKQLQLYVDGELAGTAEAAELIASEPSQSLQIGADEGSGGVGDYKGPFTFAGVIDEVRIYHGALSAQQIEQHFATPGSVSADGAELILACSFDNGKATDASGKEHHGTVESAEVVAGKVGQGLKFTPAASTGRNYFVEHDWTQDLPILVRAMVLADKTLFVVGPPDLMDEEEAYKTIGHPDTQAALARQKAALEGESGSMLLAISATDGSQLAQYELESLPSWDGLASADGSLFLTTEDGRLIRMSAE